MSTLQLQESLLTLPSQGKAYDAKMPLIDGTSVKVLPLTIGLQRELGNKGGNSYQLYHELVSKLIRMTGDAIPFDDLLVDDILTILMAVTIKTYGDEYTHTFLCDECETKNKSKLSLSKDLEIREASELDDFKTEGIVTELGEHKVEFHLLRLRDERSLDRHIKDLAKLKLVQNEDKDRTYVRYAMMIDRIDGEAVLMQDKLRFIDGLSPVEFKKFVDTINDHSVGLIPVVQVACSKCGFENEVLVSVTSSFFRT